MALLSQTLLLLLRKLSQAPVRMERNVMVWVVYCRVPMLDRRQQVSVASSAVERTKRSGRRFRRSEAYTFELEVRRNYVLSSCVMGGVLRDICAQCMGDIP
jgi:hypothetical protein